MMRPIIRMVMVAVMVVPVAVFTVIVAIVGMPLSYGNQRFEIRAPLNNICSRREPLF